VQLQISFCLEGFGGFGGLARPDPIFNLQRILHRRPEATKLAQDMLFVARIGETTLQAPKILLGDHSYNQGYGNSSVVKRLHVGFLMLVTSPNQ
jgi:hypothetical protein